jgi:hypothetical protein
MLLDEWCAHPGIAALVRHKFREELRQNAMYFAPVNTHLQARAQTFASPEPGSAGLDFQRQLIEWLRSDESDWQSYRSRIRMDRATGRAAVRALTKLPEHLRYRVFEWVEGSESTRFRRRFAAELIRPDVFEALSASDQMRFLESKGCERILTSREIDFLLLRGTITDDRVANSLRDLMVHVLRASGLGAPSFAKEDQQE